MLCGWTAGAARSVALSTTGSACAILAQDIDTGAGGPVTGIVYVQGKFLVTAITASGNGMELDAAELWNVGVYLMTVEQRSGMLIPWTQAAGDAVAAATAGGAAIRRRLCPLPSAQTSTTVLAAGGSGSFMVTATGTWTVGATPGWVACTPTGGTGTGTVEYTVAENTTGLPQQALIDMNGSKFTLKHGAA